MYMAGGHSALFFKSNTSPVLYVLQYYIFNIFSNTSPVSSSKVETGLANTWTLLGYFEIPTFFLAIPDMFVSEGKLAI